MYDVHLNLIGKRVTDFLLVIIELFLLGFLADVVRANRLEITVFEGVGHFGLKFQVEGDVPTNH